MKLKKNAQGWGMDIIIASGIFLITLTIFFIYAINQSSEAKSTIESLLYDGKIISNDILSDGYPENWDKNTVTRIGILTNNKINETKLESFYELSQNNYPKTKTLFNIENDYYFFLENEIEINGNLLDGIGKPGVNRNSNFKNMIKITRFTVYREKPTNAYLYIFKE